VRNTRKTKVRRWFWDRSVDKTYDALNRTFPIFARRRSKRLFRLVRRPPVLSSGLHLSDPPSKHLSTPQLACRLDFRWLYRRFAHGCIVIGHKTLQAGKDKRGWRNYFVELVVHPCPNLFWDMEVIVFAGVIVSRFIVFALFHKQINDLFNYCE
jgi:hypothetical protein